MFAFKIAFSTLLLEDLISSQRDLIAINIFFNDVQRFVRQLLGYCTNESGSFETWTVLKAQLHYIRGLGPSIRVRAQTQSKQVNWCFVFTLIRVRVPDLRLGRPCPVVATCSYFLGRERPRSSKVVQCAWSKPPKATSVLHGDVNNVDNVKFTVSAVRYLHWETHSRCEETSLSLWHKR